MAKRMFMTLTEDEYMRFENAREQLGMNRSQYLKYLLSGQKEIRPPAVKERELIQKLSYVDRDLRVIALKDELEVNDRILIMTKLAELKDIMDNGQLLDKLSRS